MPSSHESQEKNKSGKHTHTHTQTHTHTHTHRKIGKVPKSKAKTAGDRNILLKQKTAVLPHEKHINLVE